MSNEVLLEVVKTAGIIATTLLSTIGLIWGAALRREQKDLKVMVDGRLSDLIEANKVKDTALGKAEGKAEQKAEHKADVKEQKAEQKVEIAAAVPIELKIPNLVVEIKPPVIPPTTEEKPEENKT